MPERFRTTPQTGISLERDVSLDNAPYIVKFDEGLYEHRLREDLGFTDESIMQLSVAATDRRTIRPFSVGYYNRLAKRIVLKPGEIYRDYFISMRWANEVLGSNLRHESKHAAQDLVEGMPLIKPAVLGKSVAVGGIAAAVALSEYYAFNEPGFGFTEIAAPATFFALDRIGQRRVYLNDPREVAARKFQNDPAIVERWAGIVSLEPLAK